jgi:predicted CopG family antitoxin
MPTRTVRIEEDLLDDIKSKKRDDETISEAIGRLTGYKSSADALEDLVGLTTAEGVEEIRERSAEVREETNERMGIEE